LNGASVPVYACVREKPSSTKALISVVGVVNFPSLVQGATYFASDVGVSLSPPSVGWRQIVGHALNGTELVIQIGEALYVQ
jgi:hypothetical protein